MDTKFQLIYTINYCWIAGGGIGVCVHMATNSYTIIRTQRNLIEAQSFLFGSMPMDSTHAHIHQPDPDEWPRMESKLNYNQKIT